jgi:hypothetical protein
MVANEACGEPRRAPHGPIVLLAPSARHPPTRGSGTRLIPLQAVLRPARCALSRRRLQETRRVGCEHGYESLPDCVGGLSLDLTGSSASPRLLPAPSTERD